MSSDGSQRGKSSPRPLERPRLPAGPLNDLKSAIYQLYLDADTPTLDEIEDEVGKLSTGLVKAMQDGLDEDAAEHQVDVLEGAVPRRDTIKRIIASEVLPPGRADTVAVAAALARMSGRLPDQHARRDLASLAAQVRRLWDRARSVPAAPPPARLGRPVDDCDPFALEVHAAIQVAGTDPATALPGYVPRYHDARLRAIVDGVLGDGRSQLITLVGGSSTGKTRAAWELAQYLDRKQPGRWRLWHPYDPTRPQSVLADLENVGPQTIVWLNEAQHYLMPADPILGEKVTAGLRTLLQDPGRGPVLVLATLWPDYWNTLTTRPRAGDPDVYGQARELLSGTAITLPDTFTRDQIAHLARPGTDARLRYAAQHTEGGRITQYLAGAPELEARYRTAVDTMPGARAILQVAIDARRLGHPLALPHALLEQAAPGYLDDDDWDTLGDDWLESALAYTAQPCKGARGLLTRIRIRPCQLTPDRGQPCYRLADYLEQLGGHERGAVYPPESLWTTFATTVTDPVLLRHLGEQAQRRCRYQHAIWLYTRAADRGDAGALTNLARLREAAGDAAGAETLAMQAADRGDTDGLLNLAGMRMGTDPAGAEALYRQAADHGNSIALNFLAGIRKKAGDIVGAEALYRQGVDRGHAAALTDLARLREEAGDAPGAEVLYRRAADWGDIIALTFLVEMWEAAGDAAGAETLAVQVADRGETYVLWSLAIEREVAGDAAGAEVLYRQAADRGDNTALTNLAKMRAEAGDAAGVEALYRLAADRGDTFALTSLAGMREQAGDAVSAEALYRQAADRGDPYAVMGLAGMREQAGDAVSAEALYRQVADRGDDHALVILADLREKAGDLDAAARMRRFGLTGVGEVASGLNFGS